jgi:hypothetical protein
MNPFQKNPFVKNKETIIKGYNPKLEEQNKLENIKLNMTKLKYEKPTNIPNPSMQQRINNLKEMDKWK